MQLFHYSEEPGLQVFHPRASKYHTYEVVWAVAEEGATNFLVPRDCPRVTYGVAEYTSQEDRMRWMAQTAAERVVAIESAWLDRMRRCVMYEYAMPNETFVMDDVHAAYYVSREAIRPTNCRRIDDLLGELAKSRVEFRMLPSLWPLRDEVAKSTLRFSISRMRNAAAPVDGYEPKVPQ